MSEHLSLFLQYRDLTGSMLHLAKCESWDEWIDIARQRELCFDLIVARVKDRELNDDLCYILKQVLEQNQEIERLVESRRQELLALLQGMRRQQKISSTYR